MTTKTRQSMLKANDGVELFLSQSNVDNPKAVSSLSMGCVSIPVVMTM